MIWSEISSVGLEQTLTMRRQHNTDISAGCVGFDSRTTAADIQAVATLPKLSELM